MVLSKDLEYYQNAIATVENVLDCGFVCFAEYAILTRWLRLCRRSKKDASTTVVETNTLTTDKKSIASTEIKENGVLKNEPNIRME